jgi:AraC family transcriptional regulator, regulatory protein of adaptative response / methylated-DNA-[protein]-cysteine methyltransferase
MDTHMPLAAAALEEFRWRTVLNRTPTEDFLYAVTTQGVYCRPGCPSRPPLRHNARFYADAPAAEADGFRACKRCDPKGERAAMQREGVQAAVRMIESEEAIPSLESLAKRAGYARHHFLRLFKEITGVTPRSYAESVRGRRLSAALADGERVVDAVAGAGFGSESRVYETPGLHLGMTPGAARRGGMGETIHTARAHSAMGPLLIGATQLGVCFIGFAEEFEALEGDLRHRFPNAHVEEAPVTLADAMRAVIAFIKEPRAALDLPLDLRGTAFQRRVWEALRAIPFGETRSYSQVAASMDAPRATRAVARACAQNHVSLAVPCHRVVGQDGSLTGYRWGLARKKALLQGESAGRKPLP